MATAELIPANGIHISETYFPSGWQVARHDHEGFTSENRWFATREKAQAYAQQIGQVRA